MITIVCTLKTREDLRQLTPLEIKIADCLMECYYENDDSSLDPCDIFKEESLPILLYFNVIRHLTSLLFSDPFPRQLVKGLHNKLSPDYSSVNETCYDEFFESTMRQSSALFPLFDYEVNYTWERVLIWGGIATKIICNQTLDAEQKATILKSIQNCIKNSSFRESCFYPFLRIELDETPQPVLTESEKSDVLLANKPVTDGPQNNETISEEPFTNESASEEPSKEITLPDYIKLDNLLEKALLHYSKDEAYIQWLKALLTLTVNEQSGGDSNINNLLKAKLKLFSQKVKQKQEVEKKKHSVPIFLHLILHPEPKKLLKRLHQLIDEKSGAEVGAVLMRAQQKGYLSKVPTQAEFRSEFALVGKWNAIHNYMNDNNEKALAKANKIIIFEGE